MAANLGLCRGSVSDIHSEGSEVTECCACAIFEHETLSASNKNLMNMELPLATSIGGKLITSRKAAL